MTPVPPIIHFAHIQKTGGTTLLYHFRTHLGDKRVFVYGPHARRQRFFDGQFQLEELSETELASFKVFQGHSVDENLFSLMSAADIRLMVVLRHPVAHARSLFNQMHLGRSPRGIDVSTEYFLRESPPDFMAHEIVRKYSGLVDDKSITLLDQARSVLRSFDDVFLTEDLDRQIAPLMRSLYLPHQMERRRVANTKAPLQLTDAEICARSVVDLALFEEAAAGATPNEATGFRYNPFGHDPKARRSAEMKLVTRQSNGTKSTYTALSDALCLDLRAEEALAHHAAGKFIPVREVTEFVDILQRCWAEHLTRLAPEQLEISKQKALRLGLSNRG